MLILTTMGVMFGVGAATNLLFSQKNKKKTSLADSLPLASLGVANAVAAYFNPIFVMPAVAISGYLTVPLLRNGMRKFLKKRHLVDLLDSGVILILIILHQVLAVTLLLFSISLSRRVLARTYDNSRQNLEDILNTLPKRVWVLKDNVEVEVDYRKVKQGDIVIANTGELVPVDGRVVRGEALINQAMLTGESVPVEKIEDDNVFANTLLVSGRIFICVEQAGDQTHASEVSALVLKAADRRMAVQERGEMIAERSLRPLLGLSTIVAIFGSLSQALSVYLVTPGYTMRMLAPLALLRTLRHSADAGILVKDGRSFELLHDIDTIVFDKTGTLTDGSLVVTEIIPSADFDSHTVLKFAAVAESSQTHPIARAIITAAKAENIVPKPLDKTEYVIGRGIHVQVDNHKVMIGSLSFLTDQGYTLPQMLQQKSEDLQQQGFSLIFIAIDEAIAGLIAFDQSVRPEAKQAIAKIRQRGMKTVIISGDAHAATQYMATQLGVDHFYAETMPSEKASIIKEMQDNGQHVCFIGDGINDAAALKQAHVSMSIRGSSTIAVDTAQIVLIDADLSLIDKLFGIAKNYEDVASFTSRLAIGLPLLALPIVLFGMGGIILVIAAHNTSIWVGLWRILHSSPQDSSPLLLKDSKE